MTNERRTYFKEAKKVVPTEARQHFNKTIRPELRRFASEARGLIRIRRSEFGGGLCALGESVGCRVKYHDLPTTYGGLIENTWAAHTNDGSVLFKKRVDGRVMVARYDDNSFCIDTYELPTRERTAKMVAPVLVMSPITDTVRSFFMNYAPETWANFYSKITWGKDYLESLSEYAQEKFKVPEALGRLTNRLEKMADGYKGDEENSNE